MWNMGPCRLLMQTVIPCQSEGNYAVVASEASVLNDGLSEDCQASSTAMQGCLCSLFSPACSLLRQIQIPGRMTGCKTEWLQIEGIGRLAQVSRLEVCLRPIDRHMSGCKSQRQEGRKAADSSGREPQAARKQQATSGRSWQGWREKTRRLAVSPSSPVRASI
jgi:hypothetical protein